MQRAAPRFRDCCESAVSVQKAHETACKAATCANVRIHDRTPLRNVGSLGGRQRTDRQIGQEFRHFYDVRADAMRVVDDPLD